MTLTACEPYAEFHEQNIAQTTVLATKLLSIRMGHSVKIYAAVVRRWHHFSSKPDMVIFLAAGDFPFTVKIKFSQVCWATLSLGRAAWRKRERVRKSQRFWKIWVWFSGSEILLSVTSFWGSTVSSVAAKRWGLWSGGLWSGFRCERRRMSQVELVKRLRSLT